jgi:hypothetical protein
VLTLNTTSGAYDYAPALSYEGPDQFTWRVCDPITCTDFVTGTTDAPVVAFTVLPYPQVPPGDGDATVPPALLDTAPFFAPDLRADMLLRLQARRNRLVHVHLDGRVQADRWIESTHRVIELATNTERLVRLGGIETARLLMIETTEPIEVSVNTTAAYWPVTAIAGIINTAVTSLHLRNNSTTTTASVLLLAVD